MVAVSQRDLKAAGGVGKRGRDVRGSRVINRLLAGMVLSLTIPSLAGCLPDDSEASAVSTVVTEAAVVTDTPAPTASEKPAWYYEENILLHADPLPPELHAAEDSLPQDFADLTKAEQWKYASWLAQYRLEFETWIADNPDEIVTLTPDSSFFDALQDYATTLKIAAYQSHEAPEPQADGTCGVLDADSAAKIVIAATGSDSNADAVLDYLNAQAEGNAYCPSKMNNRGSYDLRDIWDVYVTSVTETSEDMNPNDNDPTTVTTYDFKYEDLTAPGRIISARLYIFPAENYKGEVEYHTIYAAYASEPK